MKDVVVGASMSERRAMMSGYFPVLFSMFRLCEMRKDVRGRFVRIDVMNEKVMNEKVMNEKVMNEKVMNEKVMNEKVMNEKVMNEKVMMNENSEENL
jgi:hypothetical protein